MSEYSFRKPCKGIKPKKSKDNRFLVTRELKDKLVQHDPKNPFDFITETELVETKRLAVDELVCSFIDEYLFENILRRAKESGDIEGLGKFSIQPTISETVNDYTRMPKDVTEAYDIVKKGKKIYDRLPKELTKDKDVAKFIENISAEDLYKFYLEKQKQHNVVKEEGVNNV